MIFPDNARLFLYGTYVSMKNSFDGLAHLANNLQQQEIPANAHFIFLNSRRTHIKILSWDGDNFSIWHIRLQRGTFFPPCELLDIEINQKDFKMLLKGRLPYRCMRKFHM